MPPVRSQGIATTSESNLDHHSYAGHRPTEDALPLPEEKQEDEDEYEDVEMPVVDGLMESPALVEHLSLYLKVPYFCKKKKDEVPVVVEMTGKPYCKRCWVVRHGLKIMDFDKFKSPSPEIGRWNRAYLERQFCDSCTEDRIGPRPNGNLPLIPPPPPTTTTTTTSYYSESVVYSPESSPMGEVDTMAQKLISGYHAHVTTYAGPSFGMPAYHDEMPWYIRGPPAGPTVLPAYESYDVPSRYSMGSAADLQAGYMQVEDGQENSVASTIPQAVLWEQY
ncbi:hypothetical protein D9613_000076 [Agrocybe pediades]|uniref:Uncharacterized protein n=1 Tax=Agrocybe pediades TaxID=84607 RepID=A0A8H4QZY6_9AGAR|nr:hypothetical protein D9613_000076 [Agrocybe pediades]